MMGVPILPPILAGRKCMIYKAGTMALVADRVSGQTGRATEVSIGGLQTSVRPHSLQVATGWRFDGKTLRRYSA